MAEGTGVTLVRFLGGWGKRAGGPKQDLAYRDEDGKIQYRWDRLHRSLDTWVGVGVKKQGLDLTIVLDDIPWCFPEEARVGGYGQVAPPRDFREWEAFIEAMCREILNRYGAETANRLRFRLGTEYNWAHRFQGTPEQLYRHYDHAAAAVKRVLPEAAFGPYNVVAADARCDGEPGSMHNVNTLKLAEHCATGKNYATGGIGGPLDFIAVSCYYRYRGVGEDGAVVKSIDADPEAKADIKADFWDAISAIHPRFRDIPREVHEWRCGADPLSRENAWVFHNVVRLRERGMDKLWRWDNDWIFSIFDQTVGGDTYLLHPQIAPAPAGALPLGADAKDLEALEWIGRYRGPDRPTKAYPTQYKSITVKCRDRSFIMLSTYNIDPYCTTCDQITIPVPDRLLPAAGAKNVQYTGITRTNTEEFLRDRLLCEDGLTRRVEDINRSLPGADDDRERSRRLGELFKQIKENHSNQFARLPNPDELRPFSGKVERAGGQYLFSMVLAPSSLVVVVVGS
ncbi:MAG TPA: hypothetical protein VNE39_23140 [Planctomycetota bacterium]|nr:hypothetical protein [Planctomycetota bacterium]